MVKLFNKTVVLSNHGKSQYKKRVDPKDMHGRTRTIAKDLKVMNLKHIIRKHVDGEDRIFVFTKGSKEFIFVDKGKILLLKTVIKRDPHDTRIMVEKRKALPDIDRA